MSVRMRPDWRSRYRIVQPGGSSSLVSVRTRPLRTQLSTSAMSTPGSHCPRGWCAGCCCCCCCADGWMSGGNVGDGSSSCITGTAGNITFVPLCACCGSGSGSGSGFGFGSGGPSFIARKTVLVFGTSKKRGEGEKGKGKETSETPASTHIVSSRGNTVKEGLQFCEKRVW